MSTDQPAIQPRQIASREALKEAGRYMIGIGVVDSVIVLLQLVQSGINTETGGIFIDWRMLLAFTLFSVAGAFIRALDKYKHEHSKLTDPQLGKPQGLIRF